jgi:hypothetical protein
LSGQHTPSFHQQTMISGQLSHSTPPLTTAQIPCCPVPPSARTHDLLMLVLTMATQSVNEHKIGLQQVRTLYCMTLMVLHDPDDDGTADLAAYRISLHDLKLSST